MDIQLIKRSTQELGMLLSHWREAVIKMSVTELAAELDIKEVVLKKMEAGELDVDIQYWVPVWAKMGLLTSITQNSDLRKKIIASVGEIALS